MKLVFDKNENIVPEQSKFCPDIIIEKDFGGMKGVTQYLIQSGYIALTIEIGIAGKPKPVVMLCEVDGGYYVTVLNYCPVCGEKVEVEVDLQSVWSQKRIRETITWCRYNDQVEWFSWYGRRETKKGLCYLWISNTWSWTSRFNYDSP